MQHSNTKLAQHIQTHGIILGTERYDACLAFYRDIIGLPVWYEKKGLTCLRFGNGYLMIETGGMARDARKPNSENPTMLRFNVDDVEAMAALLERDAVSVQIKEYNWGTVGIFIDPDGNACELKDTGDPYFN